MADTLNGLDRHWSEAQLLDQIQLRLILPEEQLRWDQTLCAEHYLHNACLVGPVLRYVATTSDGTWLALLGWSSPALHLRPRDRWIGWSESQRAARLGWIAQNSRFLLLPERTQYPNLASRLLALCTQRLAHDWRAAFGHPVLLAETFVDPDRFRGSAYKAAGWHCLGATGGFVRDYRDFYLDLDQPKQLWVRSLHPNALAWLRADPLPPALVRLGGRPEAPPRCAYPSRQLDPLWQRFHDRLTDPRARRGKRHLLASILATAALATLAGERGPKGFAAFAVHLTQPQRRHLRCRPQPQTGHLDVPSEPTFRRAFKRLDKAQFHTVLADWLAEHDPEKLTAVAVDGKTVKGSRQKDGRPVHLLSAVTHTTQRLLNQISIAEKSNEIPAFRPLLEALPLGGVVVTADAEHCQRAHAQFLGYEKDAEYLFLAKGNQPSLEALARTKLSGAFPPSGRDARQRPWAARVAAALGLPDRPAGHRVCRRCPTAPRGAPRLGRRRGRTARGGGLWAEQSRCGRGAPRAAVGFGAGPLGRD
ncbi:MAG: ISAs1 family transposase [Verrucomicrobia bacterium]|nr:ISAs1 family transposase [Verrucomicrobiota bacterium]